MKDIKIYTRSNYFRTTDPKSLRSLAENTSSEFGTLTVRRRDSGGVKEYAVCCEGRILGCEDKNLGWDHKHFLHSLRTLLAPGNACILTEYEQGTDIPVSALIVTPEGAAPITLLGAASARARELLGTPEWDPAYS